MFMFIYSIVLLVVLVVVTAIRLIGEKSTQTSDVTMLCAAYLFTGCMVASGIADVTKNVVYKRNSIEVHYKMTDEKISNGDDIITIDLSGTKPEIQETK